MLEFPCASCAATLRLPDNAAGKKVRCPACKAVMTAPTDVLLDVPLDAIMAEPDLPAVVARPDEEPTRRERIEEDDDRPRRPRREGMSPGKKKGMGVGMILLILFGVMGCLGVPCVIGLIFPAVNSMRNSAARLTTTNNVKQIALAAHNYHDMYKRLPSPRMIPPEGRPNDQAQLADLSWRVALLPYVEEGVLFNRFDKKADWNSPQNQPLLSPMPKVYASLYRPMEPGQTTTHFQMFTGPKTLFPDNRTVKLMTVPDGTSNTFLFAEAAQPVTWSKTADMVVDANAPLPLPADRFLVAMADGSVRMIDRSKTSDATLRLAIDPQDGMMLPADFP